ncbi:MAG: hypothetical protein ACAH80_10820 [Alphaproteobacteria bacterium]
MTAIMFRPVAKKETGELGTVLKEVCAMTALSNVKLAENCKDKEFYIADVAEGTDMPALIKALRGIKGVLHLREGANRDELESYVAKHAAMSGMDQIREMILADPHCTIGYMSGKMSYYNAGEVKALFNHAAVPQPKDLALAPDDSKYDITKAQKAALIYKASRNAGDGVIRSARDWIRARF